MDSRRTLPISYATPRPARGKGLAVGLIVGGVAGEATYLSAFAIGVTLMLVVGILCGLVVGYISARAATSRVIAAGIFGNVAAAGSLSLTALVVNTITSSSPRNLPDWIEVGTVLAGVFAVFVVPGLLGSYWVWEGRRRGAWDV